MEQPASHKVAVLSHDLFFGMRIRTVINKMGYELLLCKSEAELLAAAASAAILLVDFNKPVDWASLESLLGGSIPLIGFSSHTNVEGFREAKAAGVTRVMSNGEFSRKLPEILERFAPIVSANT